LMRPSEIDWMFGGGAGHLQPLVSHAISMYKSNV